MAAFMTIGEAAASYGLCVNDLLRDLRAAAVPDSKSSQPCR